MQKLIPIINQLQDLYTTIRSKQHDRENSDSLPPLDLPQIVVIGSQSSGKSSVLDALVQKECIPRSSGICTRRPLVLQLIRVEQPIVVKNKEYREWGEFLHRKGEIFVDFEEIKAEIVRDTERITGVGRDISDLPINLKVYSPDVVNLTCVDLPGITRVPVGDQNKNIEHLIREMCLKYIRRPNAFILAVTPANTDIATSDALQLAAEVDPDHSRTLGVITKVDLMDRGTDAVDILKGKVYPLQLGYIGLVLRSQEDIQNGKTVKNAIRDEAVYFNTHEKYAPYASKLGVPFLAKTLNYHLIQHIKTCLPGIRDSIRRSITHLNRELARMGNSILDGNPQAALVDMLASFTESYRAALDGSSSQETKHLSPGARIGYILNDKLPAHFETLDPSNTVNRQDIRIAILNAMGTKTAVFTPNSAFESLAKKQLQLLHRPSKLAVSLVCKELSSLLHACIHKYFSRYNRLIEAVATISSSVLEDCAKPTVKLIDNLIAIELSYVNINHPDFQTPDKYMDDIINEKMKQQELELQAQQLQQQNQQQKGGVAKDFDAMTSKIRRKFQQQQNSQPAAASEPKVAAPRVTLLDTGLPQHLIPNSELSNHEEFYVSQLERMLTDYYRIISKKVLDSVPKAIQHFLIDSSKRDLHNVLLSKLMGENVEELLAEDASAVAKRKMLRQELELMTSSLEIIDSIRDFQDF
ncbi:hypothetical protein PCE1_000998 [Barthelona sp. PCE]